jgi:hypothetical protein
VLLDPLDDRRHRIARVKFAFVIGRELNGDQQRVGFMEPAQFCLDASLDPLATLCRVAPSGAYRRPRRGLDGAQWARSIAWSFPRTFLTC